MSNCVVMHTDSDTFLDDPCLSSHMSYCHGEASVHLSISISDKSLLLPQFSTDFGSVYIIWYPYIRII